MADPQVALVTGASRGIGRSIALALAQTGWAVVVNYRGNQTAAAATVAEVAAAGGHGLALRADVGAAADRERLVQESLAWRGRLDLLVNNAGMAPRQRTDLLAMSEASYDEVMAVNLKGPFFLTQRVAMVLIELIQTGRVVAPQIVNIGSISAYTASVNRGEYCLSKAGMAMMTALYAERLAPFGIRVYELRPGIIATDMTSAVQEKYDQLFSQGLTPIPRWGRPEEVGRAVAAIAAGALPYSTGEVINVDGGFHLRRL